MKYLISLIFILLFTSTVNAADVAVGNTSAGLSGKTLVTTADIGTAAARNAEDTLTNGANLPDGAAILAYLIANYQPTIHATYGANDDDCTGQQGQFWWDSTDNQWEFCNSNSGVPITVGSGTGTVTVSGTPTQYQFTEWVNATTIKGTTVTGSKVVCTDANGSPTACTNLTDIYPTSALLTGYSSGAGTVADTDTLLQAINKLNGNTAAKYGSGDNVTFGTISAGAGGFGVDADGDTTAKSFSVAATAAGGQYSLFYEDTDNTADNYSGWGIYGELAHDTIYALPLAAPAAGQVMSFAAPGNQTMSDGSTQSISVGTNVYKDQSQDPVIDDADNFDDNCTGQCLRGGTFIANAAGTIVLPEATSGMNFTIFVRGSVAVVIDPLGTGTADTIYMNQLEAAQDENITSSTSGASCVIQYGGIADHWVATCNGFAEATPP